MSLNIQQYQRKPFTVEAVQVTLENMQEISDWCSGEVIVEKLGAKLIQYIKVEVTHAISERQKKAFIGDWVLKTNTGYKCYSKRAFPSNFVLSPEEELKMGVTANELLQEPLFNQI
jgi:hypothetical protein